MILETEWNNYSFEILLMVQLRTNFIIFDTCLILVMNILLDRKDQLVTAKHL